MTFFEVGNLFVKNEKLFTWILYKVLTELCLCVLRLLSIWVLGICFSYKGLNSLSDSWDTLCGNNLGLGLGRDRTSGFGLRPILNYVELFSPWNSHTVPVIYNKYNLLLFKIKSWSSNVGLELCLAQPYPWSLIQSNSIEKDFALK